MSLENRMELPGADFTISKVDLCCLVHSDRARVRHVNRSGFGLAYYTSGDARYEFDDGQALNVKRGEMIYLPKGSSYRAKHLSDGLCYAVNFQSQEPLSLQPRVISVRDQAGMLGLFQRIDVAWRAKKSGYLFQCRALLYLILAKLAEEKDMGYGDAKKRERIRPAVNAIHEGYTQPLSIVELAALCHITPEYFRVLFRQEFGSSPLKYINQLRLSRAEELLKTGLYTVAQVATLSGFGDLSRFSREFKKHSGFSPMAFARQRREE